MAAPIMTVENVQGYADFTGGDGVIKPGLTDTKHDRSLGFSEDGAQVVHLVHQVLGI